jgi:hypothetical protein
VPNRLEKTDSRRPGKPYKPQAVDRNASVAEPTAHFAALQSPLRLIHTLLGGTSAMIAAGRDYLPQHDYETDPNYLKRLKGTALDNFVETTLDTWVGKAFAAPPQANAKDPLPEAMDALFEDVDGSGTAFVQFAKSWFRSALRDREAYALIDYSAGTTLAPDDPKAGTKAADADARCSWRLIEACDMLELREGPVGPRTAFTLVRFRDDRLVPVEPWGEALEERVKVIRPGGWEVYTKVNQRGKPRWDLTESGPYDPDEVRIVRFCVGDKPPLEDLSHLNRRHWESSSDQNNVLRVTRFPILAASGVRGEAADMIVIGPNKFITTPDAQSKVYYVEHTGSAIEQGYKDLERLEDRMATYGAEFMKRDAEGPSSATEASNDSSEAKSPLRSWVLDFKDCLERAMQFSGQWMGLGDDDAGSIDFDMDDGPDPAESTHLQALKEARASRDISRKTYVGGLKRRGVLEEDYDADDDQAEIDSEPPPQGGLGGLFGADGTTAPPKGPKKSPQPPKEDPSAPPKE